MLLIFKFDLYGYKILEGSSLSFFFLFSKTKMQIQFLNFVIGIRLLDPYMTQQLTNEKDLHNLHEPLVGKQNLAERFRNCLWIWECCDENASWGSGAEVLIWQCFHETLVVMQRCAHALELLPCSQQTNQDGSKDRVEVASHSTAPFVCHSDQQIQGDRMTARSHH